MYNERICFTNNHNGRNYDDDGNTIEIINEDEVESGGFWTPQQQQQWAQNNSQFTLLSQI